METLRIFCKFDGCGPGAQAVKVRIAEGRATWWANRCMGCGTLYPAPPPGRVRQARKIRGYRQHMKVLERAGQGRLF